MTVIKDVLNAGVLAQAGTLAMSNVNELSSRKRKRKPKVLNMVARNLIGISLIKAESDIIGGM